MRMANPQASQPEARSISADYLDPAWRIPAQASTDLRSEPIRPQALANPKVGPPPD